MHDARLMRLGQTIGHLGRYLNPLFQRDQAGVEQVAQRVSLHQFHGDVTNALGLSHFIDGDDVGMVERRRGSRFPLEALQVLRVTSHMVGQDLERHLAPQAAVPRPVHFSHPAGSERGKDFIRTKSCARDERHRVSTGGLRPDIRLMRCYDSRRFGGL